MTQAKVLRVLQESTFERVGGSERLEVDVRVIAATNKNLEKEIAAGNFREDLYYRLNVIPFHVPSLRERSEDIPILAEHFVEEFCAESGIGVKRISKAAMKLLRAHAWPGNVRELRNLMERLVIMTPGPDIEIHDLPDTVRAASAPANASLDDARRSFERDYLQARLREHAGNISRTAEAIGLARESLSRKIKSHGIEVERE
jgi:two-component system nitrogen regulation response regulator NtrX